MIKAAILFQVRKGQPTPVYFNIKPTKVKQDMLIVIEAKISGPSVIFDVIKKRLIVKVRNNIYTFITNIWYDFKLQYSSKTDLLKLISITFISLDMFFLQQTMFVF
jgi:hypothetical protein